MEQVSLAKIRPGDSVLGFYLLKEAFRKTTQVGKPFLYAVLTDISGKMDTNWWEYPDDNPPVTPQDAGSIVKVNGLARDYKGSVQMNILQMRLATPNDNVDLSALVPTAPIDAQKTLDEIHALVASIADADYRAVCEEMLRRHERNFSLIPAAKNVHHGFTHGLLMHTAQMLRTADFLSREYAASVDRSLLLTGTLLHDMAKEKEFTVSPLGIVTDYSLEGNLLGHLVMGAQEVTEVAKQCGLSDEKTALLSHMILSHHGTPEYGAAVVPKTAEAELLSYIDLLDSRMEIYRELLNGTETGTFTQRVSVLDGKQIYAHEREQ